VKTTAVGETHYEVDPAALLGGDAADERSYDIFEGTILKGPKDRQRCRGRSQ
jgi:hypothetical protein